MADDLYYGDAGLAKRIFFAHATVTAGVIYSTAAATGGPLLWNGSSDVVARVLKVGFAVTTASTVTGLLGLTGAGGQTAAPSSTTAIENTGCSYVTGTTGLKSKCTPYRLGTVTNAGQALMGFAQITTGALTVGRDAMNWIDINRMFVVPPASWCSVSPSATLTTCVMQVCLVWEEVALPL